MKKATIIAMVLGVLLVLSLLPGTLTGNTIKEQEPVVITFPELADFLSPEQGEIHFEFSFPSAGFKIGDREADVIMFLDSDVISGLKLGYDIKQKKLYAGLPLLESGEVQILDGSSHKIVYAFSREQGKQALFLDGTLLSESAFTGVVPSTMPSGFLVHTGWQEFESTLPVKSWSQ